jgi:hypothetical protein
MGDGRRKWVEAVELPTSSLLSLEGADGRLRLGGQNGAETVDHDQLLGCPSGVACAN